MDPPDDPYGSQVGEPQNGPAAEEELAHSNQDSSLLQTPRTVNSRRGTQTGLPTSPPTTIVKDLAEIAGNLSDDGTDKPAVPIEHSEKCNSVREQIGSLTELSFLKLKFKEALLRCGPSPEPVLDPETL